MKSLVFLLLLVSCTQKYSSYDLIKKVSFNKEDYQRPTTLMEVLPEGKDELKACFNQWLFFSNAAKEKDNAIPMVVRSLCPGQDFLLNTEVEETWWTTILFTRSCVEMETKCGFIKGKK